MIMKGYIMWPHKGFSYILVNCLINNLSKKNHLILIGVNYTLFIWSFRLIMKFYVTWPYTGCCYMFVDRIFFFKSKKHLVLLTLNPTVFTWRSITNKLYALYKGDKSFSFSQARRLICIFVCLMSLADSKDNTIF
jgi:hypothetical protein